MKRLLVWGLLCALLLSAAVIGAGAWLGYGRLSIEAPRVISVTSGTHFEQVVHDIAADGSLGGAFASPARRLLIRLYARATGLARHLSVGEYRVLPGDNLLLLLQRIDSGDVIHHSFTLVDGWDFREVKAALAKAPSLQHRLVDMSNAQVAAALQLSTSKVEGWLAPNTYFYTLGASDLDLLKRAYQLQQQLLGDLWKQRAEKLPYKTPYDALIMASLVEKETAVRAEMPKIAGVFVSRLRKGMRLQTDPTVIYALGTSYNGRISYRDLRIDSPYNTYRSYGLPPGPIAMPSKLAITAALHPDVTGALYFVAKGDGTHQFSRTLKAHNAAVRRYQLNRKANYRSTPKPTTSGENTQ